MHGIIYWPNNSTVTVRVLWLNSVKSESLTLLGNGPRSRQALAVGKEKQRVINVLNDAAY